MRTTEEQQLIALLAQQGLAPRDPAEQAEASLPLLVREAKDFYGLAHASHTNPVLESILDEHRFCAVPDRVGNGSICRWDKSNWDGTQWRGTPKRLTLTWAFDRGVDEKLAPSIEWAWKQWELVCAIRVMRTEDIQAASVRYTHQRIDGRSGTLAWAQLPCGRDRQLESRIDASETWHLDPETRPRRGFTHLGAVMCHENGHLLGLEHDTTPARSLLDPMYGPDVLTPQAWDIKQAQHRYGPPIEVPKPAPVDPKPESPAGGSFEFDLARDIPAGKYQLTLVE